MWSKKQPPDIEAGVVFPGVQRSTWTYARDAGAWFFHRFYDFQPDLNIDNPLVREEIRRIISYWLQLGVAGFRVDAVPFLLEKPGDRSTRTSSTCASSETSLAVESGATRSCSARPTSSRATTTSISPTARACT